MSDQGKVAMDGIRRIVGEMVAAEHARLSDRVDATSDTQRYTLRAAMLGSALALAALILGTFMLQRSNRNLRRAEARLSQQGMVLQATLDNCRDGIAAVDTSGGLAAFNRRFFKLLDLPSDTPAPASPSRCCRSSSAVGPDAASWIRIRRARMPPRRPSKPGSARATWRSTATRRRTVASSSPPSTSPGGGRPRPHPPGAEDGGDRPADRRRRPRLQQPAAGHRAATRAARGASCRRTASATPAPGQSALARPSAGAQAHEPAAGLLAPAAAGARRSSTSAGWSAR